MRPSTFLKLLPALILAGCSPSAPTAPAEHQSPAPVLFDLLGLQLEQALDVPQCKAGLDGYYEAASQQPETPCWLSSSWPSKPSEREPPSKAEGGSYDLFFSDKQLPLGADNEVSVSLWNGKIHRVEVQMNRYHSPSEARDMLISKFGLPNVSESRSDTWHWASDSAEALYLGNTPDTGEAIVMLTTTAFYAHEEAGRKSKRADTF